MHYNVPSTQICHQQLVTISSASEAALKHSAQALTYARPLRMAAATLGSCLCSGNCTQVGTSLQRNEKPHTKGRHPRKRKPSTLTRRLRRVVARRLLLLLGGLVS